MYVILNDELYHFGIKGQKWGVRRFQNADGTRTESGKQRYGSEYKKAKTESRKKFIDDLAKLKDPNDVDAVKKLAAEYDNRNKKIKDTYRSNKEEPDLTKTKDPKVLYKNRDKLSDKELNDKLNRLRKENELKKLSESSKKNIVPKLVVDGGKAILTAYIIKKGTKILDNADVKIMDKLKKVTDNIFLPKFD